MATGLFQPMHLLVILIIVFIIFGAGKLPEVGKALGQGIREFKSASDDAASHSSHSTAATTVAPPAGPAVTQPAAGATAAPAPAMITCPKCHNVTQATNRFCPACGTALAAVTSPTA